MKLYIGAGGVVWANVPEFLRAMGAEVDEETRTWTYEAPAFEATRSLPAHHRRPAMTDSIALGGLLVFLSGYGLGVLVAWRLGLVKLP